jgi:hypothetical protein
MFLLDYASLVILSVRYVRLHPVILYLKYFVKEENIHSILILRMYFLGLLNYQLDVTMIVSREVGLNCIQESASLYPNDYDRSFAPWDVLGHFLDISQIRSSDFHCTHFSMLIKTLAS